MIQATHFFIYSRENRPIFHDFKVLCHVTYEVAGQLVPGFFYMIQATHFF